MLEDLQRAEALDKVPREFGIHVTKQLAIEQHGQVVLREDHAEVGADRAHAQLRQQFLEVGSLQDHVYLLVR